MTAKSKFATKRDKRRRSFGDEVIEFARDAMGLELMPWQCQVLGPALEHDRTGRFRFHDVIVTTPRQAGKSVLVAALAAYWCVRFPGSNVMFLAQTRTAASARLEGVAKTLLAGGFEGVKWYKGIGNERIDFPNGSRMVVQSPNIHGSHGETFDLVVLDEAFSYEPYVLQGVLPTQIALPNSQMWMISTQGTEDSVVFNSYCDRGREGDAGLAYFEWSADLDAGDDIYNPEHLGRWHPAVGFTVEPENVQSAIAAMSPSEAKRAFGNLITDTDEELFPDEWWSRSLDAYMVPPVKGSAYAFDVNHDPPGATVAYAFPTESGFHVGVAHRESGEGGLWIPGFMDKVLNSRRPVVVGTAGGGAARGVTPPVKEACEGRMVPFRSLGVPDMAAAAMLFYEMLRDGSVTHGESESLDTAIRRARAKTQGDQWRFDRKVMSVDSSPLVAVSLALFLARDASLKGAGLFVA